MQFIDRIPLPLLLFLTIFMLGAPFAPEPHLLQKMRMLSEGALTQPLDIFDVFWHLAPAALLVMRLARMRNKASKD
ncbi:MAG: RND transporter [Thiobacillus sp. GWE1_62_9]|nr:MAG: RND transporter [Thiobacillus sp. GWE1_62_9]HBU29524.1 RND transporter [Thiobacillus sp.]